MARTTGKRPTATESTADLTIQIPEQHVPEATAQTRELASQAAQQQLAAGLADADLDLELPARIPGQLPGRIPVGLLTVSGLYTRTTRSQHGPLPRIPAVRVSESLRLDVDGRFPQMVVSGDIRSRLVGRLHWIAPLTDNGDGTYTGSITYRDGDASLLPQADVRVSVAGVGGSRTATVTFTGGGAAEVTHSYAWQSRYFHPVEVEYDTVAGTTAVTEFDIGSHPNRPAGLTAESLSIEGAFRRAGFNVTRSSAQDVIPLAAAGADLVWTESEMHDAMQTYWSRFADAAQWRLWVLFAALSAEGPPLGGIMFDDIGPNHRQGTAIFEDSFISEPPAGDPQAAAYVARMRFWTAVHEIGHTFNLAHSWQKSLGSPWVPLSNEPEARSFMNYPYRVAGGPTAFFGDFAYRFSDAELLFMRHAPERFVQQGNAAWFDDHGFSLAAVSPEPSYALEVRIHRPARFEFLEPVQVELKLTNSGREPRLVDKRILRTDALTLIIAGGSRPARRFRPYANKCIQPEIVALMPGESMYQAVYVSAGLNGWDTAEPGRYRIQAALHLEEEDIVSGPLDIRVAPPVSRAEEDLAGDVLTDDVGRVMSFQGSAVMSKANDVLREVVERLPDRMIARHARYALGEPLMHNRKTLSVAGPDGQRADAQVEIVLEPAKPQVAERQLSAALVDGMDAAATTFGHIALTKRVSRLAETMSEHHPKKAAEITDELAQTLSRRGVKQAVVDDVKAARDTYRAAARKH